MNKKRFLLLALEFVFFCFLSVQMYHFFWMLLEDYGTGAFGTHFGFFGKYYPYYLSVAIGIYLLIVYHLLLHPTSFKRKKLTFMVNGLILAALGFALSLIVVLKMANGSYRPVMSEITFLFPLDLLIWGIIFAGIGGLFFFLGKRYQDEGEEAYKAVDGNLFTKIIKCIFRPIYVLFTMFYSGALIYRVATFDLGFEHFFPMWGVYTLMACPAICLGLYEWVYKEMKSEERKIMFQFKATWISALVTLLSFVWVFISSKADPDFLTESGTALFPLDHMLMDSPPFGVLFAFLFPVVACIASIFHWIKPAKKDSGDSKK